MNARVIKVLLMFGMALYLSSAAAADAPGEAVALVEQGRAYVKKNGQDALIREVNAKNPLFVHGSVYLAIRGLDGTTLAHPINSKLIGKNMVVLPDADGKLFRREIVELAKSKGQGWVDYRYNNPVSHEIERKSIYLVRVDDIILEVGIYKGK